MDIFTTTTADIKARFIAGAQSKIAANVARATERGTEAGIARAQAQQDALDAVIDGSATDEQIGLAASVAYLGLKAIVEDVTAAHTDAEYAALAFADTHRD